MSAIQLQANIPHGPVVHPVAGSAVVFLRRAIPKSWALIFLLNEMANGTQGTSPVPSAFEAGIISTYLLAQITFAGWRGVVNFKIRRLVREALGDDNRVYQQIQDFVKQKNITDADIRAKLHELNLDSNNDDFVRYIRMAGRLELTRPLYSGFAIAASFVVCAITTLGLITEHAVTGVVQSSIKTFGVAGNALGLVPVLGIAAAVILTTIGIVRDVKQLRQTTDLAQRRDIKLHIVEKSALATATIAAILIGSLLTASGVGAAVSAAIFIAIGVYQLCKFIVNVVKARKAKMAARSTPRIETSGSEASNINGGGMSQSVGHGLARNDSEFDTRDVAVSRRRNRSCVRLRVSRSSLLLRSSRSQSHNGVRGSSYRSQ